MNYKEAMEYMESIQHYGSVLGLENMRRLCNYLDNPQDKLKFVHVAGTNGKGSVAAYVSTVLQCAGYRAGRYISPVITDYCERFQMNGKMMPRAALGRYLEPVKEAAGRMTGDGYPHPTPFEIETAVSFLYFLDKKCDIVILETGLGGKLDATNIIRTTLLCVFTSISMDHMAQLGDSLEKIAEQKAGIIKEGCRVVSCRQNASAMHVIEKEAKRNHCKLSIADVNSAKRIKYGIKKQSFSYGNYQNLQITLAGCYQIDNAVLAVEVIEALKELDFPVTEDKLRQGLLETKWHGRFDVIGQKPLFVADGAHNEDGAARLAESVRFYFTNRRIIYIIGMLEDKEYDKVLALTSFYAEHIITITPRSNRAMNAYELAQAARMYHNSVTVADSLQEAVELAYLLAERDKDTVILAFGSLSYLGELIHIVEHRDTIRRDSHGKSEEN